MLGLIRKNQPLGADSIMKQFNNKGYVCLHIARISALRKVYYDLGESYGQHFLYHI